MTALRVPQDKLDRIDAIAHDLGMSRTQYMISAALQDLPGPTSVDRRFSDLEERLARLETQVFESRGNW